MCRKLMEIAPGLQVTYGDKIALAIDRRISFSQGDKVAILGENGSGKTTLINVLLGIRTYKGICNKQYQLEDCGIVFQNNAYSELIKVGELIKLITRKSQEEISSLLTRYDLTNLKNSYVRRLSDGERQRLTLALVLSKQKSLYFFDELTTGLDYKRRLAILDQVRKQTQEQLVVTVTHYFEEVVNWATKIILLRQGKVLFYGTQPELLEAYPHYGVVKLRELPDELLSGGGKCLDAGDGIMVFFGEEAEMLAYQKVLDNQQVTYEIIKQNLSTTYVLANADQEEHKNVLFLD